MSCPHPSKVRACTFHAVLNDVNANLSPGPPQGGQYGRGRAIRGPSGSRKGVVLMLKVARRGLHILCPRGMYLPPPSGLPLRWGDVWPRGGARGDPSGKAAIPRWEFTAGVPSPSGTPAGEETAAVEHPGGSTGRVPGGCLERGTFKPCTN